MRDRDNQEMFNWIDHLDIRHSSIELDEIKETESGNCDQEALERIKAVTMTKLGLHALNVKEPKSIFFRKYKIRLSYIAAVICIAVLISIVVRTPDVKAQLQKWLQYIPGYATVQETDKQNVLYVLESPIKHEIGARVLEIREVVIGDKDANIAVTTKGMDRIDQFVLNNSLGDSYIFSYQSLGSSTGGWSGDFHYDGEIQITEDMSLSIEEMGEIIPIKLTVADKVNRIEELGATMVRNGIGLTAVIGAQDANKVRVTILPILTPNMRIQSYGFASMDHIPGAKLMTDQNQVVPFEQTELSPSPNEIYFQRNQSGTNGFNLTIPALSIQQKLDKPIKISIPIPAEGTKILNEQILLGGIPVDLVKVERIPEDRASNQIRIYLDTHYDADEPRNIMYFGPDYGYEHKGGGYSFNRNETSWAIEYLDIEIESNDKLATFFITEGNFLYKGPWEFNLKVN